MSDPFIHTPRMRIFFPTAMEKINSINALGRKFIYYTTAATAVRLIQSNSIWMRTSLVMNDSAEIKHGLDLLFTAVRSEPGTALREALDAIFPGLLDDELKSFTQSAPALSYDTFVTSLSEYDEASDPDGQLSMWRAYGGTSGVALVLNGDVILQPSDALAIYSSPVAYLDQVEFNSRILQLAQSICENAEEVKAMGVFAVRSAVFNVLRFAATCTKNSAFKEEREWRLIASEFLYPPVKLPTCVEIIGDTPQVVIKIPLGNIENQGLYGLSLENLVDKFLIGPSEFPDVIHRAIARQLQLSDKAALLGKIKRTNIPLRPNQR